MQKNLNYILALMLLVLSMVSCSSEKAIRKGDRYVAVLEYHEAAKEYKKAYGKIPSNERKKRAEVSVALSNLVPVMCS